MAAGASGLVLDEPLSAAVSTGLRVLLREGCDHRLETCATRFDNAVNFQGEPFLPGNDQLYRYPPGQPRTVELPAALTAANARLLAERTSTRAGWARETRRLENHRTRPGHWSRFNRHGPRPARSLACRRMGMAGQGRGTGSDAHVAGHQRGGNERQPSARRPGTIKFTGRRHFPANEPAWHSICRGMATAAATLRPPLLPSVRQAATGAAQPSMSTMVTVHWFRSGRAGADDPFWGRPLMPFPGQPASVRQNIDRHRRTDCGRPDVDRSDAAFALCWRKPGASWVRIDPVRLRSAFGQPALAARTPASRARRKERAEPRATS